MVLIVHKWHKQREKKGKYTRPSSGASLRFLLHFLYYFRKVGLFQVPLIDHCGNTICVQTITTTSHTSRAVFKFCKGSKSYTKSPLFLERIISLCQIAEIQKAHTPDGSPKLKMFPSAFALSLFHTWYVVSEEKKEVSFPFQYFGINFTINVQLNISGKFRSATIEFPVIFSAEANQGILCHIIFVWRTVSTFPAFQ